MVAEGYKRVMWWLSIGGKSHSKGLAKSEWGGRTVNSYGT
jgi:hypothetical protein